MNDLIYKTIYDFIFINNEKVFSLIFFYFFTLNKKN